MPRPKLAEAMAQQKRDPLIEKFAGVQRSSGIGSTKVAEMAGMTRATLASRYRGETEFTRSEIIRIGRGLNIPVEELRACAIRY